MWAEQDRKISTPNPDPRHSGNLIEVKISIIKSFQSSLISESWIFITSSFCLCVCMAHTDKACKLCCFIYLYLCLFPEINVLFFNVLFYVIFHEQFQLGFGTTFFHPHGKVCQAFKVLQYSFVVFFLSGSQANIKFFL